MAKPAREPRLEDDVPFNVIRHTISVPPFREYSKAIIDEQAGVQLSVKQYVPRTKHVPSTGDGGLDPITIIAAGGLGFVKELYEPLFTEVLLRAEGAGLTVRSIWIADMFNVGESAIHNSRNLGCDPAWIDHTHDLWSMIQHFSKEIIRPIIGLGHSMGCNQLVCLSNWHPSLFHSLAFIEAGIDPEYGRGITIPWAFQTLKRNDVWLTREEAEENLIKSHLAQSWDERTIARLRKHGVYQIEDGEGAKWTSTTPKHQLAALVSRFNPGKVGLSPEGIEAITLKEREMVPDVDPAAWNEGPFYVHELKMAWDMLPAVRPWVLYINAGRSPFFGRPSTRDKRANLTGTGVGGNGGMKLGAVRQIIIDEGEHTMVFDRNLCKVADHVVPWMVDEARRWTTGQKMRRETWQVKSLVEKQTVSDEHVDALAAQLKQLKRATKI
ncbi:MAG: hypothetical protein Q9227_005803 [Pyrenula ochraceoflavens]